MPINKKKKITEEQIKSEIEENQLAFVPADEIEEKKYLSDEDRTEMFDKFKDDKLKDVFDKIVFKGTDVVDKEEDGIFNFNEKKLISLIRKIVREEIKNTNEK